MLKVLSYILCDLDPKVKVIGQKAGICDGVPSTSALVINKITLFFQNWYSSVFSSDLYLSLVLIVSRISGEIQPG